MNHDNPILVIGLTTGLVVMLLWLAALTVFILSTFRKHEHRFKAMTAVHSAAIMLSARAHVTAVDAADRARGIIRGPWIGGKK